MHKKQTGAVLIVSLIILVALTLFVLSGSNSVVMQEKMVSAVRDMHVSLEIAESGIADAESAIEALSDVTSFDTTGTNGLYSEGHGPTDLFADTLWADSNITHLATANTVISKSQARYFIEYLGIYTSSNAITDNSVKTYGAKSSESDISLFKIVSRSLGINGNTERIIVSHYAKSF